MTPWPVRASSPPGLRGSRPVPPVRTAPRRPWPAPARVANRTPRSARTWAPTAPARHHPPRNGVTRARSAHRRVPGTGSEDVPDRLGLGGSQAGAFPTPGRPAGPLSRRPVLAVAYDAKGIAPIGVQLVKDV